MNKYELIGIDPGLNSTGYGILSVNEKKITYRASGSIITNPEYEEYLRLKEIFQGLTEIVERFKPNQAVVEKIFVNVNAASTLSLGQARGVAIAALARHQIQIHEISALEIKKSVVGTGRASKRQVQFMIKELLNLNKTPGPDAADALACAMAWNNKVFF